MSARQRSGSLRKGDVRVDSVLITAEEDYSTGVEVKKTLVELPVGAVILDLWTEIEEIFNSGSSDLITVGPSTNTDAYQDSDDITEGTLGKYTDVVSGTTPIKKRITTAETVQVGYTSAGTAPTTGKARTYIQWVQT